MPTNPAAAAYEVSAMTRGEVLTLVTQLRAHEYSESVMLRWLEELEKKISIEIHGNAPDKAPRVIVASEKLSVQTPYDRVYWTYLVSMIDFVSGSFENFERSNALFKEAYADYARFVQRQKYHSDCRHTH